jgi:hypothetical protein
MNNEITNQLKLIIEQAKVFLSEAGEFYPFGSVVKPDGTLTPIGVHMENDQPNPAGVLEVLQVSILQRLKKKEAVAAAICLDVLYKPAGSEVKTDALKVMTLTSEGYSRDYFVPYRNEDGRCIFGEMVSEEGTLNLTSA